MSWTQASSSPSSLSSSEFRLDKIKDSLTSLLRQRSAQRQNSSNSSYAYEPLRNDVVSTSATPADNAAMSSYYATPDAKGSFNNSTTETTTAAMKNGSDKQVNDSHAPHHHSAAGPNNPADADTDRDADVAGQGIHILEAKSVHWWSYFTTADFWLVLGIGQVLALCITGTNTFTSFLADAHTNIPAFQTIFNYILLFLIYTTYFLYKEGPKAWIRVAMKQGWKYLIMSFLDVEGNYFTVLAYRYTNLLSAQLLNFWSIICVVIISFLLLKVRYKIFQMIGIIICCGGMGILLASDHITDSNGGPGVNLLKGDLFGLLGATLYGTSNVFEEWLVSKAPVYHVLSFIGFFGMIINGIQAAIFDRHSFQQAHWSGDVAGWLVGYTLLLTIFYSLAPVILRMGSAAFFDISLLTANFWGVIIGIHVFGLKIHFLYPIAFVCIIIGLVIYFLSGSMLGDSKKPWLGANQEDGFAGFGTAKLKAINAARKAQAEEPEMGSSSSTSHPVVAS